MRRKLLFGLSFEVRRNNFVLARFAQPNVFGREDIEEWLVRQRGSDTPDLDGSAWRSYVAKDDVALAAAGRELALLAELGRQIAVERDHVPLGRDAEQAWKNSDGLRLAFNSQMAVLYELPTGFIVAVALHSHLSARACTSQFQSKVLRLQEVGPFHIAEAALVSWQRGGLTMDRARTFLCNALGETIKKERQRAESAFDLAVACSADGRRIFTCSRVLVGRKGKTGWLEFPAAVFQREKILLRGDDPAMKKSDDILFIGSTCCPDPLPEGGVEVN